MYIRSEDLKLTLVELCLSQNSFVEVLVLSPSECDLMTPWTVAQSSSSVHGILQARILE